MENVVNNYNAFFCGNFEKWNIKVRRDKNIAAIHIAMQYKRLLRGING